MGSTDRNFLGQKHTLKYLKSGEVFVTAAGRAFVLGDLGDERRTGMVERAQARLNGFYANTRSAAG